MFMKGCIAVPFKSELGGILNVGGVCLRDYGTISESFACNYHLFTILR